MRLPEVVDTPLRTALCIVVLPPFLVLYSLLGMMRRAREVSVLFFAEGTRSRDAVLQPFKKGAFATAIGFGLPVLPLAIAGTHAIWPKGVVRVRRGPVAIELGEPIPIDGLTIDDRSALRDRAYAVVAELRAIARRRVRSRRHGPGGVE